jgi:hypothetical protein
VPGGGTLAYVCMSFGWYQELLAQVRVETLDAATDKLLDMLDQDGMIVHAYRDTDADNPELVGHHRRLRSFITGEGKQRSDSAAPHEIERFLLEPANLAAWTQARKMDGILEQRWSIVELWASGDGNDASMYGKALLTVPKDARTLDGPQKRNHNPGLARYEGHSCR